MTTNKIRIRSYVVGFGDCYLVTIPDGAKKWNMMIDFGNAPGKQGSNVTFPAIAANVFQETGGHLDLLVMTHEHLDHMEGFYAQRKVFDKMTIDHVWMSLPSRPDYYKKFPKAEPLKKLRDAADSFAQFVANRKITLAPSFATLLRNNLGNADRIEYVRKLVKDKNNLLYLSRGDNKAVVGKPFPKHIKVSILAPEQDMSVYYGRRMHGMAMSATALAAAANGEESDDYWQFPHVERVASPPNLLTRDWNRLRESIQSGSVETIRSIDKAANNTSLVFLLEVAGKRLLFPGDAELESWTFIEKNNKRRLGPVDFLKIAHHGSHNGTPLDQLDTLLPKKRKHLATVMVSTRSKVYGTNHPVPDADLLKNLKGRCQKLISTDGLSKPWVDALV